MRVQLRVYDLTQGMASLMAPAILGRPVEGIWHTGIVCYGKEYFFGSGINSIPEADFAQSFGMSPTKTVDLGDTEIPAEVFEEWVADRGREFFSSTSYNLIRRNCNHFTDEAAHFLVGHGIPDDISGQATELLYRLFNSPMADMIRPLLAGLGRNSPLGALVPSFSLEPEAAGGQPQQPAAGAAGAAERAAPAAQPRAPPQTDGAPSGAAATAAGTVPPKAPVELDGRMRALGSRAAPLLSLQGDAAGSIAKLLAASRELSADLRFSAAEEEAVSAALPRLLARAAAVDTSSIHRPPATAAAAAAEARATTSALEAMPADERAALGALSRALAAWPGRRITMACFVARPLLVERVASATLREKGALRALVQRALAPDADVSPTTRVLAASAVANALALPAAASELLADDHLSSALISGALGMLQGDASAANARLMAAAIVYNLSLHGGTHADDERATMLLCAIIDELNVEREARVPEVDSRLVRALGQLLLFGGDARRELATALGVEVGALPALGSDEALRADLDVLLGAA